MTQLPPVDPPPPHGDSGTLPLEPISDAPKPTIARPSLTAMSEETCPNCKAPMALSAVVCTTCGLDLREGRKREIETGDAPPPSDTEAVKPEYFLPTRMSPKVHAVMGAGFTIAAMIAAGINAPGKSTTISLGSCALTLYQTLVHTATGVVAVGIAARLADNRFSRVDFAAARMFLAFSVFQFLIHLKIAGVPSMLSGFVLVGAGAAAYFVCVMALLKKDREQTMMVTGVHFTLWLLFEGGIMLASWLNNEIARLPREV